MKILGNILFVVGIMLTVGTGLDRKPPLTNEQKIQQYAGAAVFLSVGAYLGWGKKKSKDEDGQ